jgi:hypothetical protein
VQERVCSFLIGRISGAQFTSPKQNTMQSDTLLLAEMTVCEPPNAIVAARYGNYIVSILDDMEEVRLP